MQGYIFIIILLVKLCYNVCVHVHVYVCMYVYALGPQGTDIYMYVQWQL